MIELGDGNVVVNAINGKCSKCGKCCGLFIPVTKKEVGIIKQYVKENNIKPEKRYNGKDLELRCPFLDLKNHKCKIYPVRPFVCRDFICSRKDWKKHRDKYQERADYNGFKDNKWVKKGMYSMDELVYDDISMHIRMIMEYVKDKFGYIIEDEFVRFLKIIRRIDLLEKIEFKRKEKCKRRRI